jgi:hypothetical protein
MTWNLKYSGQHNTVGNEMLLRIYGLSMSGVVGGSCEQGEQQCDCQLLKDICAPRSLLFFRLRWLRRLRTDRFIQGDFNGGTE